MRKRLFVIVCVVAALVFAGVAYSYWTSRVGRYCRVVLRRDQLGLSGPIAADFTTDVHNQARVSVSGKLVSMNDHWVVIRQQTIQQFGNEQQEKTHELWVA